MRRSQPTESLRPVLVQIDYDSRTDLREEYGVTIQHSFVLVDDAGDPPRHLDRDHQRRRDRSPSDLMLALVGAFVAGVLTTLAPCVLPLLPVVVGGSVVGVQPTRARRRALIVTGSLTASVLAFTMLLKATTALIGVSSLVWSALAGCVLMALGIVGLFPRLWDALSMRLGLQVRAQSRLSSARGRDGAVGAVLTGAALGPVFTSCSPLYAYVVVTVLPARPVGERPCWRPTPSAWGNPPDGLVAGRPTDPTTHWLADPDGLVRRALGLAFILIGTGILFGLDRDLQAWILQYSPIRPWKPTRGSSPRTDKTGLARWTPAHRSHLKSYGQGRGAHERATLQRPRSSVPPCRAPPCSTAGGYGRRSRDDWFDGLG